MRRLVSAIVMAAIAASTLAAASAGSASASSRASVIVLSPDGRDSAPGTLAQPKRTLAGAMPSVRAGTTIRLRGGTYTSVGMSMVVTRGGSAGRPVVIEPQPGESVELVSAQNTPCMLVRSSHVEVRGMRCRGDRGLVSFMASNVTFRSNVVTDVTAWAAPGIEVSLNTGAIIESIVVDGNRIERVAGSGIRIGSSRLRSVVNSTIVNNVVVDSNLSHTEPWWRGGWGSGIVLVGAVWARVEGNDVRRTYGEAYNCALSMLCVFRNNVAVDSYNVMFYADNTSDSLWQNNRGWNTGDPAFTRDYGAGPQASSGVQIANETSWFEGPGNPTARNRVIDNEFSNVQSGVAYLAYENGGVGLRDSVITGNRVTGAKRCVVYLDPNPNSANNVTAPNTSVDASGVGEGCSSITS
jgi:hypothetical protein